VRVRAVSNAHDGIEGREAKNFGQRGEEIVRERRAYRLYMSETISISVSAAAIFCSEESWGRPPPKRKDILCGCVWCYGGA